MPVFTLVHQINCNQSKQQFAHNGQRQNTFRFNPSNRPSTTNQEFQFQNPAWTQQSSQSQRFSYGGGAKHMESRKNPNLDISIN